MLLPLFDRDGWRRQYAVEAIPSPTAEKAHATRLALALSVVDDEGCRLAPFPPVPVWLLPAMQRRVVAVWDTVEVVPPVAPSRGYSSPYREQKMAAHTTVGGRGRVARVLR